MENLFGTDGIRGTVGAEPFTHNSLTQLGYAIGSWACKKYGTNCQIILGHDTRTSCSFVKAALKSGILLHSITIHDAHVLPTPTICYLTNKNNTFDCGIIVSASHNPYQDNGIKIIDAHDGKLTQEDEQAISKLFHQNKKDISYVHLGNDLPFNNAQDEYLQALKKLCSFNLKNITIVLDCAHGATYQIAPTIFEQLGAHVITINNKPNGHNINKECGALHPRELQQTVIENSADIGFAFDGDGDRLTVVSKDGDSKRW